MGQVVIKVPFKELDMISDVVFLVPEEEVPTPLATKDLFQNGLYISIQGLM